MKILKPNILLIKLQYIKIEVKNFTKRRSIHLLIIQSYSPALNGAETVIQAIKFKVQQRRCEQN